MRRFRFRPRRTNFRRARSIVRAVSGITLAKRMVFNNLTIPDVSAADFDNQLVVPLVECVESVDEEVESNGTAIADVPLYSRLTSMRTSFFIWSGAATDIRWMLQKQPDGDTLTASLIDASFHGSDDTQNQREARKNTIAKGYFRVPSDRLQVPFRIFVKPKSWSRIAPMRENDRLVLLLAKSAEGTSASFNGFGTIWCKANA